MNVVAINMNVELSVCERCGGGFECNPQNISACHCSSVQLHELERKFIALKHGDCLCGKCLNELKKEFVDMGEYYIENGFYVFTEKFLLKRGFCCKNGCRHCPYGRGEIQVGSGQ